MSAELSNNNGLVSHFGIEQRIFVIRGIQVMIDRDLAQLYEVEPKRLGEQVRRNIERFPGAFRFQLTETEKNELVANCDRFEPLKQPLRCLAKRSGQKMVRLLTDGKRVAGIFGAAWV